MESNTNNVISFQNKAPVLIQSKFKYVFTQNPKTFGTWNAAFVWGRRSILQPQLSVNPYQNGNSQNPEDPSAVFLKTLLNIEQSRFVKPIN
jgi:hypothetical protein